MKNTILIVLLILLVSAQDDFQVYKQRYSKTYESPEKQEEARKNYLENLAKILDHNAQPNITFKAGANQFSDLSPQKIAERLGVKKIRVIEPEKSNKKALRAALGAAGVPQSVDWRIEGKVTAIKSQGTCGSCWAFTTTALMESFFLLLGGSMPDGLDPDFSQQYVLECTTANSPGGVVSSCGGGIIEYALPFLIRTGMPTEAAFPYLAATWPANTAGTPTTSGICTAPTLFKQPTNTAAFVGTYADLTNDQMKDLIAFGPISGAMYVGGAFMTYSGGVYNGCPDFATSVAQLNHAVQIVGYDESGNYIIKNSWGTSWGEEGYATVSKDRDCGLSHSPREMRGNNIQLLFESKTLLTIIMLILSVLILV